MPEDMGSIDLQRVLDLLEDDTLNKPVARSQNYRVFQNVLDSGSNINMSVINRLLAVCVHDLQEDRKYSLNILKIINSILSKVKAGVYSTLPNLMPSLLAVLNIIKTMALMAKVETLPAMCFDTVLSYPNTCLEELATTHSMEVTEILNLYCHQRVPLEIKLLPCGLVHKLLKILPQDEKYIFVKENISVWFNKFIPTIVTCVQNEAICTKPLETLELLTDELVCVNYAEDPNWQIVFESIYNPNKYPSIMKNMLENGSKSWHRLWIVFIRLLKNQITRSNNPIGSPINSMLPVVETAFKLDVANRCRAFQCWDVLIDNFATETNELYVVKRLKLLIIPLKSNNAKVEETALTKFKTWWRLICKFQMRLDKFVDMILISFLHFCFGKELPQKPIIVPGLISCNTKKKSVEALIEIVGHSSESCACGDMGIQKLNRGLISKTILNDFWSDWKYALATAITISNDKDNNVTTQQITCLWKSFVMHISEVTDNNIRTKLFDEVICLLQNLLKEPESNNKYADLIMNLINALFSNDDFKELLKTKGEKGPLHTIVSIVMGPSFTLYYRRYDIEDIMQKLKPLTNCILDTFVCQPAEMINWILGYSLPQANIPYLWTALAESFVELKKEEGGIETVLWPLKPMKSFIDQNYSSFAWYKLFDFLYTKIQDNEEIAKFHQNIAVTNANIMLKFYASVVVMNHDLTKMQDSRFEKDIELLMEVTNKMEDYNQIGDIFSIFVDTLVAAVKITTKVTMAKNVLTCINNFLKLMTPLIEKNLETEIHTTKIEALLQQVEALLHKKTFSALSTFVIDELIKWAPFLQDKSLKVSWLSIMKKSLSNFKDTVVFNNIKTAIESIETDVNITDKNKEKISDCNKFTTPEIKSSKKSRKKETSVVNTVVENGEEFVVVKSNWKFNPRKLTENQKEKLQRKRDIPALYQDLSQSQDEFKLTTWKTDSQDTSSTSTKSTSVSKETNSENVSNILKQIPSSDVVPKIIENIFSENTKKDPQPESEMKPPVDSKINHITTPKETKSPRMALKDRVFRNVRNLIEKSGMQKDGTDLSESLTQIENIPKTPTSKINDNNNLVNSAPPKITTERPSRVKRKPKKFEDTEIFALKRGRRSLSQNDSQTDCGIQCERISEKPSDKTDKVKESQSGDVDSNPLSDPLPDSSILFDDVVKLLNCEKEFQTDKSHSADDVLRSNIISNQEKTLPNEEAISEVIGPGNSKDDLKSTANKDLKLNDSKAEAKIDTLNQEKEEQDSAPDSCHVDKSVKTPKSSRKQEQGNKKSTVKRGSAKKSRIEKELAIDTVEGHPFLKIQTEKRITRKKLNSPLSSSRRKPLNEKLNKVNQKTDTKSAKDIKTPNSKKKERVSDEVEQVPVNVGDTNNDSQKESETSEECPLSEDIIESSQDSTFTAISVTSTKHSLKRLSPVVEKCALTKSSDSDLETQSLINSNTTKELTINQKNSSIDNDIELPLNKTVAAENAELDSTENMDTQPIDSQELVTKDSSDVIIINDEEMPIVINSEDTCCIGPETQEIAEADTEPIDPNMFKDNKNIIIDGKNTSSTNMAIDSTKRKEDAIIELDTEDDTTQTIDLSETVNKSLQQDDASSASSPFKDEEQRKKDFLNNTFEISPIKTMSPVREKKSPSPETSSDYVVIKLTSPVQSNGEPFEKCDSPEIFTEDKVSPDKRDLSPPREESSSSNNNSPSSSLSLKKNRPQVRAGGRAAQMLGLCVPDRLHTIMTSERTESEEPKKTSPSNTPARRNLRILYNSVGDNSNSENSEENEDSENFLKFKRSLPTFDCSPSGPILKRKLAEIADDATISPASKRKRVSFHDPPVSTTISVQKYIEPCGVRSPQNSAIKRLERQNLRSPATLKSPKRLDNVFKLESVLTKAVESFTEIDRSLTDDTQSMSLDETPAVEIIKTSDLNDTDPICPELADCKDPIENIAMELSSPSMKLMLLKELEGKIATIGDLAKMTELEVNRLCIKAPKVKVVKKVLSNYKSNRAFEEVVPVVDIVQNTDDMVVPEDIPEKSDIETQTNDVVSKDIEIQTVSSPVTAVGIQTEEKQISNTSSQTNESGSKSTKDLISTCLAERPDFVKQLGKDLDESCKLHIANTLPFDAFSNAFMKKVTPSDSKELITRILEKHDQSDSRHRDGQLSFLQDYLCDKFDSKELIMFSSKLLAKIHDM